MGSKERKGAPELVNRSLFRMMVSFGSFRIVVKRSTQCNDQLPLPPAANTAAQGAGAKLEAGGSSRTWIRCPMTRAGRAAKVQSVLQTAAKELFGTPCHAGLWHPLPPPPAAITAARSAGQLVADHAHWVDAKRYNALDPGVGLGIRTPQINRL